LIRDVAPAHVRSGDELRDFFLARGEQVFQVGPGFAVMRESRHGIAFELVLTWDAERALLIGICGLPLEVRRVEALHAALAAANLGLLLGCFTVPRGVAYRTVVPLAHDGTLSTAAALRLVDAAAAAWEEHLPALRSAAEGA